MISISNTIEGNDNMNEEQSNEEQSNVFDKITDFSTSLVDNVFDMGNSSYFKLCRIALSGIDNGGCPSGTIRNYNLCECIKKDSIDDPKCIFTNKINQGVAKELVFDKCINQGYETDIVCEEISSDKCGNYRHCKLEIGETSEYQCVTDKKCSMSNEYCENIQYDYTNIKRRLERFKELYDYNKSENIKDYVKSWFGDDYTDMIGYYSTKTLQDITDTFSAFNTITEYPFTSISNTNTDAFFSNLNSVNSTVIDQCLEQDKNLCISDSNCIWTKGLSDNPDSGVCKSKNSIYHRDVENMNFFLHLYFYWFNHIKDGSEDFEKKCEEEKIDGTSVCEYDSSSNLCRTRIRESETAESNFIEDYCQTKITYDQCVEDDFCEFNYGPKMCTPGTIGVNDNCRETYDNQVLSKFISSDNVEGPPNISTIQKSEYNALRDDPTSPIDLFDGDTKPRICYTGSSLDIHSNAPKLTRPTTDIIDGQSGEYSIDGYELKCPNDETTPINSIKCLTSTLSNKLIGEDSENELRILQNIKGTFPNKDSSNYFKNTRCVSSITSDIFNNYSNNFVRTQDVNTLSGLTDPQSELDNFCGMYGYSVDTTAAGTAATEQFIPSCENNTDSKDCNINDNCEWIPIDHIENISSKKDVNGYCRNKCPSKYIDGSSEKECNI